MKVNEKKNKGIIKLKNKSFGESQKLLSSIQTSLSFTRQVNI